MGGEEKGKGDLDCFASLFWAKRHSAGTFPVGSCITFFLLGVMLSRRQALCLCFKSLFIRGMWAEHSVALLRSFIRSHCFPAQSESALCCSLSSSDWALTGGGGRCLSREREAFLIYFPLTTFSQSVRELVTLQLQTWSLTSADGLCALYVRWIAFSIKLLINIF